MSYQRPGKLTWDGRIYRHFEEKAISRFRSLPGAKWNSNGKYWQVNVTEKDMPRILEVCHELNIDVDRTLLSPVSPASGQ